MSKPTASAAGGAMPAEGQQGDLNLVELVDEIFKIRSLVECGWMAAGSLHKHECNALQTVLGDAEQRLAALRNNLNIARGAPEDNVDD